MATALTADAMLAALAKWGITPRFHRSDWRTYNRNDAQGWGPLYGFVIHCFGSDGSDSGSLDYLRTGDPLPPPQGRGLPGPLSQFAITDDGQVWIIGWGTANHMGSIDPRLHGLVLKDAAPLNSDFVPNVNFKSAGAMHNVNDNYLGVEMTYGKAPTAAQRKSVALLSAALMDALGTGYTAGSVIGHREATTDRGDPTGIPMWQLRREINALLKAGPSGAAPVAPQEADMQFSDKIPGTNLTVGQVLNRAAWAYDQLIDGGSIDNRIDSTVAAIGQVREAIVADDKAAAQAILDKIQISLSVKPDDATPPPAA